MNTDFMCERRLAELDPNLHKLTTNTAFVMMQVLDKYQSYFPTYTDHTVTHSLQVLDFCNKIIGENIEKLNADELYVLIMSAFLHDSGMGISEKDYARLKEKIVTPEYMSTHEGAPISDIIRDFHQEFSAGFIDKYADFFEIPSPEHVYAIQQVSRGHRKSDLWDEKQYPVDFKVPGGNTVCLPYLAALIRLADELDIAADRNASFIYTIEYNVEFKKHNAIRHMVIAPECFFMDVADVKDPEVEAVIDNAFIKLNKTLSECIDVVHNRTDFVIHQDTIFIRQDKLFNMDAK